MFWGTLFCIDCTDGDRSGVSSVRWSVFSKHTKSVWDFRFSLTLNVRVAVFSDLMACCLTHSEACIYQGARFHRKTAFHPQSTLCGIPSLTLTNTRGEVIIFASKWYARFSCDLNTFCHQVGRAERTRRPSEGKDLLKPWLHIYSPLRTRFFIISHRLLPSWSIKQ
jgi:hypothetical protein